MKSLSGGTVKQDRIAIGFPNGSNFYRPRSVQAKEDAARLAASHQNAFRHTEGAEFQLVVLTQYFVDIFS
jgi:hypothetical protein